MQLQIYGEKVECLQQREGYRILFIPVIWGLFAPSPDVHHEDRENHSLRLTALISLRDAHKHQKSS